MCNYINIVHICTLSIPADFKGSHPHINCRLLWTALLWGKQPWATHHGAKHFSPLESVPQRYSFPMGFKAVSFTVLWHDAKFLSRKTRIKKKCHPSGLVGMNTPFLLAFQIKFQVFKFKHQINLKIFIVCTPVYSSRISTQEPSVILIWTFLFCFHFNLVSA